MGLYDQINSTQVAIRALHQATTGAMAAQKIAQRDYEQAQAEADKWKRRYGLALKEGREDLARKAQLQNERYKAIACRLKTLVDQQIPQVDAMKHNLASWESKVAEAQNKVLGSQQIEASTAVPQPDDAISTESITFDNLKDFDEELTRLKVGLISLSEPQEQATDAKGSEAQEVAIEIKNPEETIEESIRETREAVNSTIIINKYIQQQYNQAKKEAKNWHEKVQLALQKDDEDFAVEALLHKTVKAKVATVFKSQLEQQEATVKLLKRNLAALEKVKHVLSIEAELAEMKAQMLESETLKKTYSLPAASLFNQVIDAELLE